MSKGNSSMCIYKNQNTSKEGEFGWAVLYYSQWASERVIGGGAWWRFPLGSHVPQTLISLKGVRGSTFLLVADQEWGPSPGSFVDRTVAMWSGQYPEPGQRGARPAEHRNGGSRLEQVSSERGRSWSTLRARTLRQG